MFFILPGTIALFFSGLACSMGPYAASHDLPIRMTPDSSAPMSAAAARAALQARLPLVRKPAQYLGLEHNAVC